MSSTHGVTVTRAPVARLQGWPLVGWASLALLLMTAAIFLVAGIGEAGLRMLIRATARTSLVLFLAAFVASSLRQLWPMPATRWLLTNRRYVGVSFAVSHFLHLLAIVALAVTVPEFEISTVTLIGGGMAYVFIAAMVATSFDRTTAWLGPRRWRLLHTAGMYYVWIIFVNSYVPRALIESPAYLPFAASLLVALGLRIYARRKAATVR